MAVSKAKTFTWEHTALKNLARLIKLEARAARKQTGGVAIADSAKEIRLDDAVREKLLVHPFVIEAGHGSAIETQGAGGYHEIGALQRAVAESILERRLAVSRKPTARVRIVREQLRKLVIKHEVETDNRAHGGGQCFFFVGVADMGRKPPFGFIGFDKQETGRGTVGARGAQAKKIVKRANERVAHGLAGPCVLAAR